MRAHELQLLRILKISSTDIFYSQFVSRLTFEKKFTRQFFEHSPLWLWYTYIHTKWYTWRYELVRDLREFSAVNSLSTSRAEFNICTCIYKQDAIHNATCIRWWLLRNFHRQFFEHSPREVGGWGRVPFSKNLMSPTSRRKWYLMKGRRAH